MVNLKSELEIRLLHEKIDQLLITQEENLLSLQQSYLNQMKEIAEKVEMRK